MDKSDKNIFIDERGNKIYKNSKAQINRDDGPAIEWTDGTKHWYKEGERHRLDGPACECSNGNKVWYKKGKCHRVDGPAEEYTSGNKYWYILYKRLEEKEFNSWINRIKIFII